MRRVVLGALQRERRSKVDYPITELELQQLLGFVIETVARLVDSTVVTRKGHLLIGGIRPKQNTMKMLLSEQYCG